MKRPPDIASIVIAVIAVIAGVRAGICMIAVPSLILVVKALGLEDQLAIDLHGRAGVTGSETEAEGRHRRAPSGVGAGAD
jgi:ammonia channel protein AmtB